MRILKGMFGLVLAATAAAYLTGLTRVLLGFAFGTDEPYFDLLTDVVTLPLLLALLEWPITALIFSVSVLIANFLQQRVQFGRQTWLTVCALSFAAISVVIVAATYSQSWSEPLFKVTMLLAFCVGGLGAALLLDALARPRGQAS